MFTHSQYFFPSNIFLLFFLCSSSPSNKIFSFQNIFLHFLLCFTSQQTNIVFQIIGPFPSQLFSYPNKKYFSSANNCFHLLRTKHFTSPNIFSLCFSSHLKSKVFFSPFPSPFLFPPLPPFPLPSMFLLPSILISVQRPTTKNLLHQSQGSTRGPVLAIGSCHMSYVMCQKKHRKNCE